MTDKKTIKVRQTASGVNCIRVQKATLKALGLGKINRVVEIVDTPAARGMVARVAHLVKVEN